VIVTTPLFKDSYNFWGKLKKDHNSRDIDLNIYKHAMIERLRSRPATANNVSLNHQEKDLNDWRSPDLIDTYGKCWEMTTPALSGSSDQKQSKTSFSHYLKGTAVYKRTTRLWPRYFWTWPDDIFLIRRENY